MRNKRKKCWKNTTTETENSTEQKKKKSSVEIAQICRNVINIKKYIMENLQFL